MPSLIGNKPNQVPSNGDLGTLAFQDSNAVNITGGVVDVSAGTAALPTLGTTGDPNTGVFFPAADTVAVATNGVEAVRVDSSGNLGVGVTPSTFKFDVFGINGRVNSAPATSLTYFDVSNAYGTIRTGVTSTGVGYLGSVSNFPVAFYANNTERMRLDTNGNLLVGTTSATSGGAKLQTVDGITFPATQVASANANTLDDYEEGTWTPVLRFGGTSTGITYVAGYQNGLYTKVGRLVTLTAVIYLSNKGSSVGDATISGLPFNTANTAGAEGAAGARLDNISFTAYPALTVTNNTNLIGMSQTSTAGVTTQLTNTQFANNSYIQLTISYMTS